MYASSVRRMADLLFRLLAGTNAEQKANTEIATRRFAPGLLQRHPRLKQAAERLPRLLRGERPTAAKTQPHSPPPPLSERAVEPAVIPHMLREPVGLELGSGTSVGISISLVGAADPT